MKTNLKWSFGNMKLQKLDTVAFDLPAYRSADGFVTCPGAGACAAVCYAQQDFFRFPLKKAAMEHNLATTKREDFVELTIADLRRIKQDTVRIHASGDFYNQTYLEKWFAIVKACPEKLFYAYTKSLLLDFSAKPANLRITQSLGGKWDKRLDVTKPHSRIFATVEDRERAGYVDGNKDDSPAILGETKIGLVYHGGRNLTPAQERYFA